ncbi:hypothetical protein JRO89_XS04G0034300 [Xanthoceras sorbifolium]|uniref:Uncharacterized protein n=1 Tax=Xanthoceras sorbifolium TaxID=99658 RepID=A0ABQ8I417_9ROSI|nr:hypothetical protein JRO89_XS04G0034300 [Xanthoceras sorbifolium]
MSTNEADLGEGSVDESLEDVEESQDHMEEGDGSESSSSSDASIESQYNRVTAGQNLNQFVPAILRRAVVPFNTDASVPPISIAPSPLYLPPPPMAQQNHEMGMSLINPNRGSLPFSHVGGVFPGNHQRTINHGPPFPGDYHHQAMRIDGPTNNNNNNYQLPTSNLPSDFGLDSASARVGCQMRMNWEDNILPASNIHQVNWIPEAQNFVTPATPPNPRRPINSVYDPLYETMGLPVDPHLRMFLASRRDNAAENNEDKLGLGL